MLSQHRQSQRRRLTRRRQESSFGQLKRSFLIKNSSRLAAIEYTELSYLVDSNFNSHRLVSMSDRFLTRTLLWDLVFEESLMQTGQQNWGFSEKIEQNWLGANRLL
jgi:hypothetical protein